MIGIALGKDPQSGYVRRNLSPPGVASPIQLVDVWKEFVKRGHRLADLIQFTVHQFPVKLDHTDINEQLGQPVVYRNPGRTSAHYLVALTTTPLNPNRRNG